MLQTENQQIKLDASVPANNYKIIEIYNKVKKDEWDVRPSFQRKLVWKKQHKINFIETILLNYPFPEIYIAPGEMDSETLKFSDIVVDGQQRTTTIVNYIEAKDIFAQKIKKLKSFKELSDIEKRDFLNFEVSIRYLKNATPEQIKNIFQRINSSEYSLNQIEKSHAQYGDSEFILFAKQIIEKKCDIDYSIIEYKLDEDNQKLLHDFFVKKSNIFNDNDIDRMLALQYIITLLSTFLENGVYFNRVSKNEFYIQEYNGEFPNAFEYEQKLVEIIQFIESIRLSSNSMWFTKSNIFTLIIELYKFNLNTNQPLDSINLVALKSKLDDFEKNYYEYLRDKENYKEKTPGDILYFEASRQGVNDAEPRANRGKVIEAFIHDSC